MNNDTEKIAHNYINQKVYKILKEKIVSGHIKPNSKLSETEVMEALGVSRTPVREAIQKLVGEGYVEKKPKLGVIVTEISLSTYKEVSEIRGALEGLASYYFVKRSKPKQIEELKNILNELTKICNHEKIDQLTFSAISEDFHKVILYNCGNKYLIHLLDDLYKRYGIFRGRTLRLPYRYKDSLDEHIKILEAIEKKDAELAKKLSIEHNLNSLKAFLNLN